MSEQFAEKMQRAMDLARKEARRHKHEYVGTEHILLGVTGVIESVGARALQAIGENLHWLRLAVEKQMPIGPKRITGDIPLTPRASAVIDYANAEARDGGCSKTDTGHVLVGIFREHEGLAAQIIMMRRGALFAKDIRERVNQCRAEKTDDDAE